MKPIHFIVGTMLGSSEYVADHLATLLPDSSEITQHLTPDLNDFDLTQPQTWIICTSTHGAGDYPDNIQAFVTDLENSDQDLSSVKFLTIGIGDSSYDTFCFAAKKINKTLISKGCNEIIPLITLDMSEDIDPEERSQSWLDENKDHL